MAPQTASDLLHVHRGRGGDVAGNAQGEHAADNRPTAEEVDQDGGHPDECTAPPRTAQLVHLGDEVVVQLYVHSDV